jgi:hypothetical protein
MIRLPSGLLIETFQALRRCGEGRFECVAYWTGPSSNLEVDGIEHPVHLRSPFGYDVDTDWLTEFWKRLFQLRRCVKAQVHTHPGQAFHSPTDNEFPIVSQPGFISVVIPWFAQGEETLDGAWVGRLRPDGEWQRLPRATEVFTIV